MTACVEQHQAGIGGALSCFARLMINRTLAKICHPCAMAGYRGVRGARLAGRTHRPQRPLPASFWRCGLGPKVFALAVLILTTLVAVVFVGTGLHRSTQTAPPNLLIFLTDDQNHRSLGAAGNPVIQTPNIDALAAEGVAFTNAFVTTSICAVNRASLLTGQTMRRHGIDDFETPLTVEAFAQTYPARLRTAGYRTGYLGKFGIGRPSESLHHLSLPAHEFDLWYGFPQEISYRQVIDDEPRYLTTVMTEKAIDFLREAKDGRPFVLTVAFKEPHGNHDYFDPDVPDPYTDVELPVPSTLTRTHFEALPAFIRESLNARHSEIWLADSGAFQNWLRTRYRLISRVDRAIGEIMEVLRESGLDRTTVVLYTADNGKILGQQALTGKWLMYEDSIRVPLIVRDPRLPSARWGRQVDAMVLSIDIAPTLLAMAGLPASPGMQGRDFSPLLRGEDVPWREDWYYEHTFQTGPPDRPIPRSEGVRTARWKYVRYPDQSPPYEQVFDLSADPQELHNLAADPAMGGQLERLRTRCDSSRRSLR